MLYLFKRTFLLIYRNKDNSFRFQWLSSLFIKGYKNKSTFANKNERSNISSVTDKSISISCVSTVKSISDFYAESWDECCLYSVWEKNFSSIHY
jgi:hypothetical protein